MTLKYPDNISDETRLFMNAVMKTLNSAKVLSDSDAGGIRMLMLSYDMFIKASNDLLTNGPLVYDKRGRSKSNPAANITKSYYAQVVTFMREFGLTPKSRERIKSLNVDIDDDNPLLRFLRENK